MKRPWGGVRPWLPQELLGAWSSLSTLDTFWGGLDQQKTEVLSRLTGFEQACHQLLALDTYNVVILQSATWDLVVLPHDYLGTCLTRRRSGGNKTVHEIASKSKCRIVPLWHRCLCRFAAVLTTLLIQENSGSITSIFLPFKL